MILIETFWFSDGYRGASATEHFSQCTDINIFVEYYTNLPVQIYLNSTGGFTFLKLGSIKVSKISYNILKVISREN